MDYETNSKIAALAGIPGIWITDELHQRFLDVLLFLVDEGPTLETLDFTIRIASNTNLFTFRLQVKYSYFSLIWFNLMPTKQWSHVELTMRS